MFCEKLTRILHLKIALQLFTFYTALQTNLKIKKIGTKKHVAATVKDFESRRSSDAAECNASVAGNNRVANYIPCQYCSCFK